MIDQNVLQHNNSSDIILLPVGMITIKVIFQDYSVLKNFASFKHLNIFKPILNRYFL